MTKTRPWVSTETNHIDRSLAGLLKKKEKAHIHRLGSIDVDLMTYTKAISKIVRGCVPRDIQCKNDVDDFQGKLNGLD